MWPLCSALVLTYVFRRNTMALVLLVNWCVCTAAQASTPPEQQDVVVSWWLAADWSAGIIAFCRAGRRDITATYAFECIAHAAYLIVGPSADVMHYWTLYVVAWLQVVLVYYPLSHRRVPSYMAHVLA